MGHRYDTRYNRQFLNHETESENAVATPYPFRVTATPISGRIDNEEERRKPANLEFAAFGRFEVREAIFSLTPLKQSIVSLIIFLLLYEDLYTDTILTNCQERVTHPRPHSQSNTPLEQEQTRVRDPDPNPPITVPTIPIQRYPQIQLTPFIQAPQGYPQMYPPTYTPAW